jgi:hypothetical protein
MAKKKIELAIILDYAQAKKEINSFKGDIKEISAGIRDLNLALGEGRGGKEAATSLQKWISAFDKFGSGKSKAALDKFTAIGDSFGKISAGIKDASANMEIFDRVVSSVASSGKRMIENQKEISAVSKNLGAISRTLQALSSIDIGSLKEMRELFSSISRAASSLGSGGLVKDTIETIVSKNEQLAMTAKSVKEIAAALASAKVTKGATAIASIGNAFRGVGGGGMTPGGGGMIVPEMKMVDWKKPVETLSGEIKTWEQVQTEALAKVKGASIKDESEKIKLEGEKLADQLEASLKGANQHLVERIMRWQKERKVDISHLTERGILRPMKEGGLQGLGMLSASGMAGVAAGKKFWEETPGQRASYGMMRGTMIHEVLAGTMQETIGTENIGGFLMNRMFEDPKWKAQVKKQAKEAALQFKRMAEAATPVEELTPAKQGEIVRVAAQISMQIKKMLGPTGVFNEIYNLVVKKAAMQGQTLKQAFAGMSAIAEKELRPLIMLEPGALGGGVPKEYTGEEKVAVQQHLRTFFKQLQQRLVDLPERFKEIMALKNMGLLFPVKQT